MTEIVRLPKRTNESGQGPRLTVIDNPQAKQREAVKLAPLQAAHAVLITQISSLAPSIPVFATCPEGEDVRAIGGHLWAFAQAVDAYVKAVGAELGSAVLGVDVSQFAGVLTGALDGNAMHEIEAAAVAVEEGTEIVTGMWAVESGRCT